MKCILHGTILSIHYIYYFSMTSYPFEFQLITYHCTLHLLYHEIIKLYFWILSMAITLFRYLISVRCLYFIGLNYLLLLIWFLTYTCQLEAQNLISTSKNPLVVLKKLWDDYHIERYYSAWWVVTNHCNLHFISTKRTEGASKATIE